MTRETLNMLLETLPNLNITKASRMLTWYRDMYMIRAKQHHLALLWLYAINNIKQGKSVTTCRKVASIALSHLQAGVK